jgi:hypothetical protein
VARWARAVWDGWAEHHAEIRELLAEHGLSRVHGGRYPIGRNIRDSDA